MGKTPDVVAKVNEAFLVSIQCSNREGCRFTLGVSNSCVKAVRSNACNMMCRIPNAKFLGVRNSAILASQMDAPKVMIKCRGIARGAPRQ
eukprot:11170125-Lingulodinium_polyedra.AAC.1